MSTPAYVVPVITGGATIVAAAVGFAAAALKHHWDVKDNDVRWGRELKERRREELKLSLVAYFRTRNRVLQRYDDPNLSPETDEQPFALLEDLENMLDDLALLLDEEEHMVFVDDMNAMIAWTARRANWAAGKVEKPALPSFSEIKDLAQRLLE